MVKDRSNFHLVKQRIANLHQASGIIMGNTICSCFRKPKSEVKPPTRRTGRRTRGYSLIKEVSISVCYNAVVLVLLCNKQVTTSTLAEERAMAEQPQDEIEPAPLWPNVINDNDNSKDHIHVSSIPQWTACSKIRLLTILLQVGDYLEDDFEAIGHNVRCGIDCF